MWEQAGDSGELTITIPGKFKTATPVDLRSEHPGTPLAITGGKLITPLKAYAPASFILK